VSDKRLVPASFEELAMPLLDRLYNFAHWLTRNREEAEDLVQETFAKALKGFSSFQPGTNFRAWIYRILRNTFLTSRTGLKSAATVPLDSEGDNDTVPATQSTPESILLERLDHQWAREALDQLPVHYREILLLCEVEEMSYQVSRSPGSARHGAEIAKELKHGVRTLGWKTRCLCGPRTPTRGRARLA
jgi:RNA polymerase sigma-70 factor (ECF subfamily)